jgi:GTP-binding protein
MTLPPLIAIVGRPNVGKSTLFNRLVRRRQAVVDDMPGVTRDRVYAHTEWSGVRFRLVDTGGLVPGSDDPMESAVRAQAMVAIEEAVVVLFVVEVTAGLTALDQDVAHLLRRSRRPVVLAVNKVDDAGRVLDIHEFHALGLGMPLAVSAISGRGSGDLLEALVTALPAPEREAGEAVALQEQAARAALEEAARRAARERTAGPAEAGSGQAEEPPLLIAVLGRPNVGKSSFVNAVVGRERVITSPEAGTTRDSSDIEVDLAGRPLVLIDTAGLRRRTRVKESVEYYSALRALQSLDRCDVALLLVDAVSGISDQDVRILERILARGKGAVVSVNKWDLVEKETGTAEAYEQELRRQIPFAPYVPVVFISATNRQRVVRALELAVAAGRARRHRVTTSVFNTFMDGVVHGQEAITPALGEARIYYGVQAAIEPPTFLFFVNAPEKVKPNFKRFLERRIREQFSFEGTPLRLRFRGRS